MALFVVIPLGMVVYYSFTDESGSFTLSNFRFISQNFSTILDSLETAVVSTAVCLVLAYPLSLIMMNLSVKRQRMMNILIMLPMWMNFILRICSWQIILENNGILNQIFGILGFGPYQMLNTTGAVVVGTVYNFLPFMVLPIYSVMSKISKPVLEASRDLGCNYFQMLRRVIFPLSIPGVISGITMVFVPAASTFIISRRLGNYNLIGDTIEQYYVGTAPDMHAGSILSLVLMIVILISMAIMNHFDDAEDVVIM